MGIFQKKNEALTDRLAQLIGSDTVEDYYWTSGWNTALLQLLVGLRAGQKLLDIGCGSGRLAQGLQGWFGSGYVGVDIMPDLIEYCRKAFPQFRFDLLDLESDLYNPESSQAPEGVQLDFPDASFDCITLFSVLTHVTTGVTQRYFDEIHRLLAPGGSVVFTCFLLNEELDRSPNPDHRFPYAYDSGCFYENEAVVSEAVAYRADAMNEMLSAAKLSVVFQESGSWTGREGLGYQDIVVAQRRIDIEAKA